MEQYFNKEWKDARVSLSSIAMQAEKRNFNNLAVKEFAALAWSVLLWRYEVIYFQDEFSFRHGLNILANTQDVKSLKKSLYISLEIA